MTDQDGNGSGGPHYSYRPSLIGPPLDLRLKPHALAWSLGSRTGEIPYSDIRKIQLMFRPGTVQNGTFVCYIWPASSPKVTITSSSRRSMVDVTRQDAPYRDFIVALHRHLANSGAPPEYVRGVKPYVYWPGIAIMAVASLGFAMLIVRALQTQAWAGAGFIAAFLGLFLWQLGGYFRRNRPGDYRADNVPVELLPGS